MSDTDKPKGSSDELSDGAKDVVDRVLAEENLKSDEKAKGSPDVSEKTDKPASTSRSCDLDGAIGRFLC